MRYDRAKLLTILLLALTLVGLPGANGAESRGSGPRAAGVMVPATPVHRGDGQPDRLDETLLAPGDEIPPETQVPLRSRAPSTTLDPGRVETFDAIDASGGEWYMNVTNDGGVLAWRQSYVLNAYLTMYEATGERRYLDKSVIHARAAVAHTDQARGVRDYRGKSLPAWRAGGRYTVGTVNLLNRRRRPVIKLIARLAYGTSIRVGRGPRRDRFTLLVVNSASRVRETYRNLSINPHSDAYYAWRINGTSRLITARPFLAHPRIAEDTPGPTGTIRIRPKYYLFAVHTGLIAMPLARFAAIVNSDPSLRPAYGDAADSFLSAASRAVMVHNDEWVEARGYGYYKYRRGAPVWADGIVLPHNQNSAMGRAYLELYRATGVDAYRDRAAKLAATLKRDLRLNQNNAYVWNYWWGSGFSGWGLRSRPSVYTLRCDGYRQPEDLSHGSMSVDFAAAADRLGIAFTQTDTVRFANTLHANMTRPASQLAFYVTGVGGSAASDYRVWSAGWLELSSISRDVFRTTDTILDDLMGRGSRGGMILYAAARNIQGRHALKAEPRPLLAPTMKLAGPVPSPRIAGSFTMAVEVAAHATPIVTFFIDGSAPVTDVTPPYQREIPTTSLRDGTHRFSAVAIDPDGRSAVVPLRLVVDNTGPVVSTVSRPRVISPNGDGYAERTTFAIRSSEEATALLRLVNVATRRVTVPATDVVRLRRGGRSWIWDGRSVADGRIVPNGRYMLTVIATDTLGNRGRVAKAPVGVNTTLYKVSVPWSTRRGRPVSARYTLKYRAGVWVTVLGSRARVVARIHPRGIQSSGRHAIAWNGRNRSGGLAGRGAYTFVVYARNSHGTVSVVRRVRVTR